MPIDIVVPRLGWSMEEGAFVAWLQADGAFVRAGDPLFSIEGDKAIQEIESIDSGVLRIQPNGPKPGDPVRVGQVLGQLMESQDRPAPKPIPAAAPAQKPESTAAHSVPPLAPATPPQALSPHHAPKATSPSTEVATPSISPRALQTALRLGIDWTRLSGTGRTGRIRERDVLAAVPSKAPAAASAPAPVIDRKEPHVLVTGGCGFIGTWVLRELLATGHSVVVLDPGDIPARWDRVLGSRKGDVHQVRGSLLDRELLARTFADFNVTHVIHLAALLTPDCQADPWQGCQVNVLGTVAILEAIRACASQVRGFSYASSVAVFGDEPDTRSSAHRAEGHIPKTFYGAFKDAVEAIAQQYWRHFQIPSVGIRPQVAYGPERETGLTAGPSLAAKAAARGEAFTIGYTGSVGYDYVEDVAHAFVRAAFEPPQDARVVDLPGEFADITRVIEAIEQAEPTARQRITAEGPPVPAIAPPSPHFISELYPDWQTTRLADGLRKTVEYHRHRA